MRVSGYFQCFFYNGKISFNCFVNRAKRPLSRSNGSDNTIGYITKKNRPCFYAGAGVSFVGSSWDKTVLLHRDVAKIATAYVLAFGKKAKLG